MGWTLDLINMGAQMHGALIEVMSTHWSCSERVLRSGTYKVVNTTAEAADRHYDYVICAAKRVPIPICVFAPQTHRCIGLFPTSSLLPVS